MSYSIMIDAGHGGRDPGAVYNGRQEKDDTLRLALAVGEILQNRGIDVEYTRTTDVYETPYEKAMEANQSGADLFLSIHRNSFPTDNEVSGVEALVYDLSGLKLEIAEALTEGLATVGFEDLGVKARPNLVVLKRTQMPAVLLEAGFINSDTDNMLFDQNFDDIALVIAEGILDVLQRNGLVEETDSDMGVNGGGIGDQNTVYENDNEFENQTVPEYRVQTGAFRNRSYAERLRNELLEQDFPAYIDDSDGFLRVQVGNYGNLDEAVDMERRLKRAGYATVIVSAV